MVDYNVLVRGLLAAAGGKQDMLAKELEVSQPTVSRWLKGGKVSAENRDAVLSLAMEKGLVNHDPFSGDQSVKAPATNSIPEIQLTAGLGGGGFGDLVQTSTKNGMTFSKDVVRDHWRLPDWILSRINAKAASIAAFPVQGDSMDPTLRDGDVVFVNLRHRVPSPDGIYALADEFGGVIVKRLEVTSRPGEDPIKIDIISDNPRHSRRNLTLGEIHIIGRYVGKFTT
jgi:hypothetical protein